MQEFKTLSPRVLEFCNKLFFRQSLIKDYLTCPNMALYRWVLQLEEEDSWMASVFGTAGHKVLEQMHTQRKFDYKQLEIMGAFEKAFYAEIEKMRKLPRISTAFDSMEAQFAAQAPLYTTLLCNYQSDRRNQNFHSTINEQLFVLEFDAGDGTKMRYTGTIDQGGYYMEGTFAIRDAKFRQNDHKPSRVQLLLDIQQTVYAAAVKYGNPACENCRPHYIADPTTGALDSVYNGPCAACAAKIGTPEWPRRFAERCELLWMRDYERHTKDEYQETIKDPEKKKVFSVATGRKVIRDIPNPKWAEGYKKGDFKGEGILTTARSSAQINVLMSDVSRICHEIRQGVFYRKPSKACNWECQYREQCVRGVELEVREVDMERATSYGTVDPFGEG